ncbi:MAG: hypothetical protein KGJ78_05710 [Alphaproteobacteria bacterium]|nr:hypothetical protein [Alphaproteobacteria bacterium]
MNPELERNVWLELTPRRLLVMTMVLALAFFAAAVTAGTGGPAETARWAYYIIVVIWGSRNAARSVVGEIRDHTWDTQRLSSLPAGTMMWGKLFGATSYNWFGGVLCLAVILASLIGHSGVLVAIIELVYYLSIGMIAQSVALLASLMAAGRRQGHSQFEVFLYQGAGMVAAIAVYAIWSVADPAGSILLHHAPTDFIVWWGRSLDARGFLLISLALFAAWTLTACYREMRIELQMRNGPLVWLAFLLFIGVYVAGFDAWLSGYPYLTDLDAVARRLLLAGSALAALSYVMVFLEPKNRVQYRWLAGRFGAFELGTGLSRLQSWMMSYLAAVALGVVLVAWLGLNRQLGGQGAVGAMLGFFTRDMAIVVLAGTLSRRRTGDFAAAAILFMLYVLLPAIIGGLNYGAGTLLFFPRISDPVWLSPTVAWAEAAVAWAMTISSIALPERQPAAT